MTTKLTFLGTGGGRYATIYQTRCTGGTLLETSEKRIHIDPGPGALTNMSRICADPAETDAILISHFHPDHCSDAGVLAEGMCKGGVVSRGFLAGSVSVMEGDGTSISKYHLKMVGNTKTLRPGDSMNICGIPTEITGALHTDPTTVGFIFNTDDGKISYVSDTQYKVNIAKQFACSRVLILPITRPTEAKVRCHLCTEDAVDFANIVKPEMIIFNHMGVRMIYADPKKEAAYVESKTGIRTVAAEDLMMFEIADTITYSKIPVAKDD